MPSNINVSILPSENYSTNVNWSESIEELFLLEYNSTKEVIQLHDYQKLYAVPNLYNHILNDILKCTSQNVIAECLQNLSRTYNLPLSKMKILDFAAGSGLVAKAIYDRGGRFFIGVDIEKEARKAVERDFPSLYTSYHLLNFCELSTTEIQFFKKQSLDALVAASALGFGKKHVPVNAFANAFNLIRDGGLVVFCIYDQYLSESDKTGYKNFLDHLKEGSFDLKEDKRYVHRMTTYGTKIWYRVLSGFKKSNFDDILKKIII